MTRNYYGDPFVDIGAAVLRQLLADNPNWGEKDAIRFATRVYVDDWQGKLHAFFQNSGITNPSNKGREAEKSIEYYEAMLKAEVDSTSGPCRVSGVHEPLFPAGRDNQMLAGSGAFLNFHHGLEGGLRLGKSALLSMYFAPLGCIEVSGSPALVHSSRPDVTALLAVFNLRENQRPSSAEFKPGLAKAKRSNPANALFGYVDDILKQVDRKALRLGDGPNPALTLYNFTNFGAKPDVTLYHLSASVFKFYADVVSYYPGPWQWFVRAHYLNSKFKDAQALPDTPDLMVLGKSEEVPTLIKPNSYQGWSNKVYKRLIAGQSLLPLMRTWAGKHLFPFALTSYYCEKLLHMDHKTLELIAHLARYLATETDDSVVKRTLTRLSTARTAAEVRLVLVGLQRRNYETDAAAAPLMRLDDYVRYLFPEGTGWREIRDLLLISLYEQLHESHRKIELDADLEEVPAAEFEDEYSND